MSCEYLPDATMETPPPQRGDAVVERLADQRMGETDAFAARPGGHQMRRLRALGDRHEGLVIHARGGLPDREGYVVADHRRDREQRGGIVAQADQPILDDLLKEPRHRHLLGRLDLPSATLLVDHAFLFQRAQEFDKEERIALGPTHEVGGEPRRLVVRQIVARADKGIHRVGVEWAELDSLRRRFPHDEGDECGDGVGAAYVFGAIRREDQERQGWEPAGDVAQQIEAGGIRPVQVIEEEDERSLAGDLREECVRLREERLPIRR